MSNRVVLAIDPNPGFPDTDASKGFYMLKRVNGRPNGRLSRDEAHVIII